MRRVILLSQYLAMGGLERLTMQLSIEMKRRGDYEPIVFAYDESKTQSFVLEQYEAQKISVKLRPKGKGFSWSTVRWLVRESKALNVRVIHTHDLGPLIYASLARIWSMGCLRVIHTQHSELSLGKQRKHICYHRIFSLFVNRLVAVSEAVRRSYFTHHLFVRPRIIPNGIPMRQYPRNYSERIGFKEKVLDSLPSHLKDRLQGKQWALSLGRVSAEKGVEELLAIWRLLDPKNWVLVIVGPEQSAGYLGRLPVLENAVVIGPSSTPELWIGASDLFISASFSEGMPLTPIEALASNVPVVLSEIPGHEMLRSLARFFPVRDTEQAAKIVAEELEKHKDSVHFPNTAPSIYKRFNLESTCASYEQIYRELS